MSSETVVSTDAEALRRINEPSVDTGQATAGGAATLEDTAKTWMVNEWAGRVIEITEGTGKGQFRNIVSNTATILTVAPAWTIVPDATSWYRIGLSATGGGGGGPVMDSGVATGGAVAALIDAVKNWDIGVWEGKIIKILSGVAEGNVRKIISNTGTQINVGVNFSAAIVAGVNYAILDDIALTADVRRSATSTLVPLAKQMEEGIVTTAGAGVVTVTDANKNLGLNIYAGYGIRIVSGTGAGSVRTIVSNTAGAGTIYTCDAVLTTGLDSKYIIFSLPDAGASIGIDYGTATNSAFGNMQDTTKFWGVNIFEGKLIKFLTGPAVGCVRKILSNDVNNIIPAQLFSAACGVGSRYVIFDDVSSLSDVMLTNPALSIRVPLAKQMEEGMATILAVGQTLTDTTKFWDVNLWIGYCVRIVSGTGAGQVRLIASNTLNVLTTTNAWAVLPTTDSKYIIFYSPVLAAGGLPLFDLHSVNGTVQVAYDWTGLFRAIPEDEGIATAGGAATLTDGIKLWVINMWIGYGVRIVTGTGAHQVRRITSNIATQLTVTPGWVTPPGADSRYVIFQLPKTIETGVPAELAKSVDEGQVTFAGAGATVTDGNKSLSLNCYAGYGLRIVAGTGIGSARRIVSNTAAGVYTVDANINTDTSSIYIIYPLPLTSNTGSLAELATLEEGAATLLSVGNLLTDNLKFWDVNMWTGKYVKILSGTGVGQVRIIASNTLNALTVINAWAVQPDIGARYVIFDSPLTSSLGVLNVVGNVAHDAADSSSPVKTGGKAKNFDGTEPGAAVAENDRADHITDVYGRQFVETTHPNYWNASADYVAAQANAIVVAAPGAGLKLYITDIMISNGATAGNITLLDGAGGAVKFELYPAINGGVSCNLRTPIALTAATALCLTSTTVTTHTITVSGYIAP